MTTLKEIIGDAVYASIRRSVQFHVGDAIGGAVSIVENDSVWRDSVWESVRKKICRPVWLFTNGSMYFPLQISASEIVDNLNLNYFAGLK